MISPFLRGSCRFLRTAWLGLLPLTGCQRLPFAPPPLVATGAVETQPPPAPAVREVARGSVLAVGDIMMHGMVLRSAAQHDAVDAEGESTNHGGFDALFAPVSELIGSVDLAFGNLETPVAPNRGVPMPRISDNAPVFNAPVVLLESLHDLGFDVLSFANNHSYDQQRVGLEESLEHMAASPMVDIGAGLDCDAAWAPRIVHAGPIAVGFIGATELYNYHLNGGEQETCVATLDIPRALAEAKAAREAGAEVVVVSVHWGTEYAPEPEERIVRRARRLIDGGVDIVLGHHPHVIQPVELYDALDGRVGVIAYSLGNFVSNQSAWFRRDIHRRVAGDPRDGLALRFDLVRRDFGGGVVRTTVADLEAVPLWTTNNSRRRKRDQPVVIRPHLTQALLDEAQARLAAARAADDAKAIAEAGAAVAWLEDRLQGVRERVGPGLVR